MSGEKFPQTLAENKALVIKKYKFPMARLKTQEDKRIPVPEDEYLRLMENTLIVEALKIAGIEEMPVWKAMMRILDDKRVEIHVRPVRK